MTKAIHLLEDWRRAEPGRQWNIISSPFNNVPIIRLELVQGVDHVRSDITYEVFATSVADVLAWEVENAVHNLKTYRESKQPATV